MNALNSPASICSGSGKDDRNSFLPLVFSKGKKEGINGGVRSFFNTLRAKFKGAPADRQELIIRYYVNAVLFHLYSMPGFIHFHIGMLGNELYEQAFIIWGKM